MALTWECIMHCIGVSLLAILESPNEMKFQGNEYLHTSVTRHADLISFQVEFYVKNAVGEGCA